MKFAKKLKQKTTPSLKLLAHKSMAGVEKARSHKRVHASDLTKDIEFCPREFALLDAAKKERKGEFIGTSLRMTFDLGEALHDMLREKWVVNNAVGSWRCHRCGAIHQFCKRPTKCKVTAPWGMCGGRIFSYKEEFFISNYGGFTGSLDLIVDLGMPKLIPVEIKSIDKDYFKELMAPHGEHKWRTNLYLRLIADSSHPHRHKIDTDRGLVFYIIKGYGIKDETLKSHGISDLGFTPFKEFWVTRNDVQTDSCFEKAKAVKDYREGGKMPGGICKTGLVKRAQQCSCVKECWSGNYPAGL